MAPQGFLAAGAGAGAADGAGFAAVLLAFCEGAAGAAGAAAPDSRWVTLLDCLPNDFPPPSRFAASALNPESDSATVNANAHNFIRVSWVFFLSALDSNMQGRNSAS
jgi:hypothetical protein